jgi:hypothetical protein
MRVTPSFFHRSSISKGGFAWIPESILRARLRAAYRFRVALTTDPRTHGTPPAITPLPSPPAAPGQTCPQGYSSILGACVPNLARCAPGTLPTLMTLACLVEGDAQRVVTLLNGASG